MPKEDAAALEQRRRRIAILPTTHGLAGHDVAAQDPREWVVDHRLLPTPCDLARRWCTSLLPTPWDRARRWCTSSSVLILCGVVYLPHQYAYYWKPVLRPPLIYWRGQASGLPDRPQPEEIGDPVHEPIQR